MSSLYLLEYGTNCSWLSIIIKFSFYITSTIETSTIEFTKYIYFQVGTKIIPGSLFVVVCSSSVSVVPHVHSRCSVDHPKKLAILLTTLTPL
jgi:hypothetical protein